MFGNPCFQTLPESTKHKKNLLNDMEPLWNSSQFEVVKRTNTIHWQMHDFATDFDKLRPKIRKHNKNKQKLLKRDIHCGQITIFSQLLYLGKPYFQTINIKKLSKRQQSFMKQHSI
jgi:hypothetical protein